MTTRKKKKEEDFIELFEQGKLNKEEMTEIQLLELEEYE